MKVVGASAVLLVVLAAASGEEQPQEAIAPGLAMTVRPAVARDGSLEIDTVVVRMLALAVERGEPVTPFVSPGGFTAEWRGVLDVPRRDDWTFSFEGRGELTLELDGEVVLHGVGRGDEPVVGEAVRIKKGGRELVARYRSTLTGAGSLRVFWENRKLFREPIPATALSHDPTTPGVVDGALRREGRMLLATARCTACHATESRGMPELAMRGPSLEGAGARLDEAWLAAWIRDPHALREDARMPRMLNGDGAQDAADLAAFVASLGGPVGEQTAGSTDAGARLWNDLGCFSCHGFDSGDDGAWVRLDAAGAKFRPGAMALFLQDPARHDPWIRMPDLKLGEEEARDLEAFVRSRSAATFAESSGDAARGRELFARLCADCHEAGVQPARRAPPLDAVLRSELDAGCLSVEPPEGLPEYAFGERERAALHAFASGGSLSLVRDNAREIAARQLVERRCDACHVMDGRSATWTAREVDHAAAVAEAPAGDHGVVVQQLRPALTFTGEKLRRDWTQRFLAGEEPSPRPWLHARMPRLTPMLAEAFAHGLAAQHGVGAEEPRGEPDRALGVHGARLLQQQGGFACVTCHAVSGDQPTAVFEVQGIDLALAPERLRHDWFLRWMLDPPRYEPAAKMPKYASDDGTTPFDVLGGDARRQFEAIWQHLRGLSR